MASKVAAYRSSNAVDTVSLPAVVRWLGGDGDRDLGFDRVHVVMADNRTELASIYGKRHGVYSSSFRFDIWNVQHEGMSFWVLSAKVKGTCIEVAPPDVWSPRDEGIVVSFYEALYQELKDLGQEL